ncbi:MAG: ATP-binding cassette domain-containing protein [Acidimicrobiales bacterium]|jgi:ABC-2 type transport system ATP-binding protein
MIVQRTRNGAGIGTIAIEASSLGRSFGRTRALAGLDLAVPAGTVLGLLGPNGSGKTTAVRVLTTLLRPDKGTARVAGYDVVTQATQVRRHIGLSGQAAALDESLTGSANLVMIGQLNRLPRRKAQQRAAELLSRFDLTDAAARAVKTYSGGMRRRLDLAASLVTSPPVLFLDEPTTGLDPRSRLALWEIIRTLVADGTTVLLTTQYLEEADLLADRIVVIDSGSVIAEGTSEELKARVGGDRLEVTVASESDLGVAKTVLAHHAEGKVHVDLDRRSVDASVPAGAAAIPGIAAAMGAAGVVMEDLGMARPSLDDVFLTLTGHSADPVAELNTMAELA